jgi:hypothetical protein
MLLVQSTNMPVSFPYVTEGDDVLIVGITLALSLRGGRMTCLT